MPLVLLPLAAAATLVFTPVLVVARSVMRGRDALLFARPLRAEIRPRWMADGSLDVSMLLRNRLAQPVRVTSAVMVRPRGASLAGGRPDWLRSPGVALNLPLPGGGGAADWVGLRARPPRGWPGGWMALRLTLADAAGKPHAMLVRVRIPRPWG